MRDDRRSEDKQRKLGSARRVTRPEWSVDIAVAEAMAPYADTAFVRVMGAASELTDEPPLIAAGGLTAATGLARNDPRLMRTGLRMLAAHLAATGLKSAVKSLVDRPRPHEVAEDGHHKVEPSDEPGSQRSFPSGHTAGAVAVARAVARDHRRTGRVLYGGALVAALAQLPRHAHFPSDIAVGILIGVAAEEAAHRALEAVERGEPIDNILRRVGGGAGRD